MPALGPVQRHLQLSPGIRFLQLLLHRSTVQAQLGKPEHPVGVDPGVGAANGFLNAAAKLSWISWHLLQSKKNAAKPVAYPQPGPEIQGPNHFGRFVPGITEEPLVGSFPGEDNFLTAAVNALRQ